jgi:hypothetical protein
MTAPHINQLREHLLATLADLRNRENPMEPDRARAVAQVASVLVDTAKVEVDYLKATNQDRSGFLEEPAQITTDASGAGLPLPNGISAITRHRLKG